jgi:hypothetical protein
VTPLDDCSPEDEVVEELDVLVDVEVLDEVDDVVPVVDVEDELPGIVAALTALKRPRPATAANAAPTVSRLSRRRAASRAYIRRWAPSVFPMARAWDIAPSRT